jgi:hypothetical protein
MLMTKEEAMRTASGLAATLALLISSTRGSWAQAPDSIGPSTPRPLASGSVVATILTLGLVAVIVFAVVAVARFVAARRKRMTEAMIFQSQLSDAVAREPLMQGLRINPRARVSGWRRSHVTIEVAGEVPTPALREKAMRIVEAEAWRLRPDIKTVDHLFIVPPPQRVSESFVPRG